MKTFTVYSCPYKIASKCIEQYLKRAKYVYNTK